MNGYLSHLVGEGCSATIEPRALSRFEPVPSETSLRFNTGVAGADLNVVDDFVEASGVSRSSDMTLPDVSAVVPPPAHFDDTRLQARIAAIASQLSGLQSPSRLSGELAQPAVPQTGLSTAPKARQKDIESLGPTTQLTPIGAVREEVVIRPGPSQPPIYPSDDRPAPEQPESIAGREVLRSDNSLVAPPRVPQIVPEQSASSSAITPSQPNVSVTIGRLEIKAVPTVSSAGGSRGESRRSRVMSLDQYLQRRAAGGVR